MKRLSTFLALVLCTFAALAGTGFHVTGSKLYDANGAEFRPRGVNHVHWDQGAGYTGVPLSGANTERMLIDFSKSPASNALIVKKATDAGLLAIPGNWNGTCKSDAASLAAIVDTWVAQASTWAPMSDKVAFNIANEWGLGNSVVWRDEYVKAIARMRAAGYTGLLVVDSGSCGQDSKDVITYGPAVLASDPLHNILFDVHVYGGFHLASGTDTSASWQQDYVKAFAALKASGLPIIVGEFGPGRSVGPSPTLLTPERLIADAEDAGFGWLAWAWDDNNLANCQSSDAWFSLTINCGRYTGLDSELTTFGKTIVPLLKQYNAKPAAPAAAPAGPVYTSPTALWCQPNYSCYMTLSATSPAGAVKFAITGNDARISMGSTGLLAWWSSPAIGTYPMTLVLTDTKGNTSKAPVVLTVSWVKPL
jgi:mannan endo-1,4-beta-mannosidase